MAGLTESLRAAQIDTAIESISGSPMPMQNTKTYPKIEARVSRVTSNLSPSKPSSTNEEHRTVSTHSSPSSNRLIAIRNSPDWRGDGKGNDVCFVRQSTIQPDDPFVSNNGTDQSATTGVSVLVSLGSVSNHQSRHRL